LPVGPLAVAAVAAAATLADRGVAATVVDPRWVRPLDPALVAEAARHPLVVTVEDNSPCGGFGDALARALRDVGAAGALRTMALPPDFVEAGTREQVLHAHGLDADGIVRTVSSALA
jgi:1-deoxy-D-xylulose-5-phosphate synthase